ncbi:hypothetical protein BG844_18470 [Couchioplanes caeruleus subsp. caeruleus]|uniref:Uncharacterized protein n=1 Tax=Couchioplanes caeruleus subsp. caeruleus TaxID=56427 RepID=A0A1K0FJ39_9ACTN|nr:hypothetical protein BG844_18470 [Couchioplanes caeruleus subsp. caeruleus]
MLGDDPLVDRHGHAAERVGQAAESGGGAGRAGDGAGADVPGAAARSGSWALPRNAQIPAPAAISTTTTAVMIVAALLVRMLEQYVEPVILLNSPSSR